MREGFPKRDEEIVINDLLCLFFRFCFFFLSLSGVNSSLELLTLASCLSAAQSMRQRRKE